MEEAEEEEEEKSTKKYNGRTDNNSPTRPNKAIYVATLLLKYLLDREKWQQSGKLLQNPLLPPAKAGQWSWTHWYEWCV